MQKAVIFDLDGVIVDSEPAHFQADNALFELLGIKIPDNERELFYGVSSEWMWDYIIKKYSLNLSKVDILELDIRLRKRFLLSPNLPKTNPGLESLLQKLINAGFSLAVASSTVSAILEPLLREIGILKYFDLYVAGDQVEKAKPSPDVYLLASKLLNIPTSQCLAIEDSPNGIIAAKTAGMKCIAYSPSNHSMAIKRADHIITHFDEIDISLIESIFEKPALI